jgi:hypothetical protein
MEYKVVPRIRGTKSEQRVRGVIAYLKEKQRWVTASELREATGMGADALFYVTLTMRLLGFVEEGRAIQGRGRPAAAFHWKHNKAHRPVRFDAADPASKRMGGENRGLRSLAEIVDAERQRVEQRANT